MKALNLKLITMILSITAFTFISCKKDKNDVPAVPGIEGNWVGKYGSGNAELTLDYRFNILPGGKLQVKDNNDAIIGQGTWKLIEGTFEGIYGYAQNDDEYNLKAKYDEVEGSLFGSWGEGTENPDGGEFYLLKQ
jgi:hypothetical protein